ncbi:hypothetical protein JW935_12665 [candidate division KSB1 bacterium]|nr:hypothetical protein [candidate division KSB1 bacterium]
MFPFIRPGDIIAYTDRSINKVTSQRVVRLNGAFLTTRGDNNVCKDERQLYKNIMGKVVKVFRRGKNIKFGIMWGNTALAFLSGANILHKLLRRLGSFYSREFYTSHSPMPTMPYLDLHSNKKARPFDESNKTSENTEAV